MELDRLDKAILLFEDEKSELTLGERISILRQALMWNSFEAIKKIKKFGKKGVISDDEEYKAQECMRQFKTIEAMYNSELKAAKASGKSAESMNASILSRIKDMKSSIGDIITTIPT